MPKYTLPSLPYSFSSLEPHIDAKTMEIHHGKHHQAYVDKLNAALEQAPEWQERTLEQVLCNLEQLPEAVRTAIRNNGGGHYNHSLFWTSLAPAGQGGGGKPTGTLADALTKQFGSFAEFQKQFADAALARFGSGWVWLVARPDGTLAITSTANQDVPIMTDLTLIPLLGLDVWEHAYYLHYQNRRPDYVDAWWNVVNWGEIEKRWSRFF